MALLLASAGYPGPHVAHGAFFGASLQWSALSHVAAFIIGDPEAR
jgi:hypothetical protein